MLEHTLAFMLEKSLLMKEMIQASNDQNSKAHQWLKQFK